MNVKELLTEISTLSVQEQEALLEGITRLLEAEKAEQADENPKHSLLELEGLGAELWEGIDAQDYVNELRQEWDHRP